MKNGDTIFIASAAATPSVLVQALVKRASALGDITLLHFITDGLLPADDAAFSSPFRHRTLFVGREMRALMDRGGIVDYVPISLAQVPGLVLSGRLKVDVALIHTTRPDDRGQVSLGTGIDIAAGMLAAAPLVIAEFNALMPRTFGDAEFSVDCIDFAVETRRPLPEYRHPPADEVTRQVGRYISRLIDDGSTLQVGVGQIPNEAMKFLSGRRHLGVHSDVITDTMLDLIDAGIVDGREKTVDRGKIVSSYCFGTQRLYDRIHENPDFVFRSIDKICDPSVIAAQDRMVSISQVFSIDLTGQACSDQFDGRLYGGICAQPDLLRAAALSRGGKPIICLASTDDSGLRSRIRPMLPEGEGVTVARSDVHYVVTEYGVANLFGRSFSERALALIELAHPRFRSWLLEEAKRLGHLSNSQTIASRVAYPVEEVRTITAKGGARLICRPAKASDGASIRALFHGMTQDDIYTRFFSRLSCLSFADTQRLCNVDYTNEVAFIVTEASDASGAIVGTASYYRQPGTDRAEVAYMLLPSWQGLGVGRLLQSLLFEYGKRHGISRFVAEVLRSNKRMVELARASCSNVEVERLDDTLVIVMTP